MNDSDGVELSGGGEAALAQSAPSTDSATVAHDDPFQCDVCLSYSTDDATAFRTHLQDAHEVSLKTYLTMRPLHRCHAEGCTVPIATPERLFCSSCRAAGDLPGDPPTAPTTSIPCQFCGQRQATINDPFCSPTCAAQGTAYGHPLTPPVETDDRWQAGDYRFATGILSSTPRLVSNTYVCRVCYQFGSDRIASLANHVSSAHGPWERYIERFALQRCRTCRTPLATLESHYCSRECQVNDPDPVARCPECGTPVDKDNQYCSPDCGFEGTH